MHTVTGSLTYWVAACLVCLLTSSSKGEILEVPEQYATIQVALDATEESDTVRVAPGVYHEFLLGPNHNITLTGWHRADTLAEFRTVLDPIPIGVDTPSVAQFWSDTMQIRNFAFFNRPEMREYDIATRTGGVQFYGTTLRIENCRFDSVSRAVNGGQKIIAKNCVFNGCLRQCIRPSLFGAVDAELCVFDGDGNWLVRCYSNSSIRNCDFLCSSSHNDLLSFSGENIEVVDCRFGPCYSAFPILRAYILGNCRIVGCVFQGIERVSSLIEVSMPCPGPAGIPIRISNNLFEEYYAILPSQGTPAIKLLPQDNGYCYFGVIENNVFRNAFSPESAGIVSGGSVDVQNNLFDSLSNNVGNILVYRFPWDTVRARGNMFLEPGIAASGTNAYCDAQENWWGDSTGPFHPSLNPEGLGTEVGNGVIFEPWLTQHPDSADTNSSFAEQPVLLPDMYSLSAFPNPFNATTTLSIQVAKPGLYDVILYDVTGRKTAKLFHGRIVAAHEVQVSAEKFATGIYFARLIGDEDELAVLKLVLLK